MNLKIDFCNLQNKVYNSDHFFFFFFCFFLGGGEVLCDCYFLFDNIQLFLTFG